MKNISDKIILHNTFLRIVKSKENKNEAKKMHIKNEKRREKRKAGKVDEQVENASKSSRPVCTTLKMVLDNSPIKAVTNNSVNKRTKGCK